MPTIWSYGHRNPEGLAWDPVTGRLWESEHGPTGGDEINIIEKGHNYGWGVVSKGMQAGITKRSQNRHGRSDRRTTRPRSRRAASRSTPALGIQAGRIRASSSARSSDSSCAVSRSADEKVVRQEVCSLQFGRVRDIIQGPDGYLYVAMQKSDRRTTGAAVGGNAGDDCPSDTGLGRWDNEALRQGP